MPLRSGFSDILRAGLFSGLVSGFVLGILVCIWNLPLILEAEKFESKSASENSNSGHTHAHSAHVEAHSHAKVKTSSSEDIEGDKLLQKRNLGTVIGSVLLGISFGVLVSLWMTFFPPNGFLQNPSQSKTIILSILFTIGGFLIFFGIPFLGLPPELPGRASSAYDYPERQAWWYICVGSSSVGVLASRLILSYLNIHNRLKWVFAIILFLFFVGLPFYLGAPKISENFAAPKELRIQFEYVTLLTNLLFWFLLSSLFFLFWKPRQVLGFK
ncbi:cobalt transporter [Leptospira hartskeerlii]|uniref:Cobalt transporter n=1 Tax=Leptospira hartskeerlii TaxID=2023177 RepID=A0A2M9XFE0_9LEPT|nr:CbtA family protein [Leptospira hartskeerlii]PJZ26393.1 cobalt transporter [Leptospira hartskeerlii]PJZ34478.1 cobalt transporter [Leptospira hartskeerlii]